MDEPDLQKAVKNNDVDPLRDWLKSVLDKSQNFINSQTKDLDEEDKLAVNTLEKVHLFYVIVVLQTIIVIVLGLYQVFSFKNNVLSKLF